MPCFSSLMERINERILRKVLNYLTKSYFWRNTGIHLRLLDKLPPGELNQVNHFSASSAAVQMCFLKSGLLADRVWHTGFSTAAELTFKTPMLHSFPTCYIKMLCSSSLQGSSLRALLPLCLPFGCCFHLYKSNFTHSPKLLFIVRQIW